ncbi:MAG: RraA family protein [Proteobacteria bacterium]|nr:RraA family protein [Pseudomonadota bacterium]
MMAKAGTSAGAGAVGTAIRRLKRMPSGFVTDAMKRLGLSGWTDGVFPVSPKGRVVGPAATLRYAPRRGADAHPLNIYGFIRTLRAGDVLVITTDETECYSLGENAAHHAQGQGLAGVLSDGRVRDYAEIAELKMPVFCRGPAIRPHALEVVGVNVPVSFAGAQVNPGDIVVGDADGIVVIPLSRLAEVVAEAEDIGRLEIEQEKAIRAKAPMTAINEILGRKRMRRGA